jgi:hypothetical protein
MARKGHTAATAATLGHVVICMLGPGSGDVVPNSQCSRCHAQALSAIDVHGACPAPLREEKICVLATGPSSCHLLFVSFIKTVQKNIEVASDIVESPAVNSQPPSSYGPAALQCLQHTART